MRLGRRRQTGKRNSHKKYATAGEQQRPKHVAPDSIVGQVSGDLIANFASYFKYHAQQVLEQYATRLADYDDTLQMYRANSVSAAEVDNQGNAKLDDSVPPQPPHKPLWHSQYMIDEFASTLVATSEHFFAASGGGGFRVHVNAAKFERLLDERYGIFRPFITRHPELEAVLRNVQRKYASVSWSPFRQTKAPIPISTAVVILFMMQRGGMRWEILTLSSLFLLVGLQPWALVFVIALLHVLVVRRRHQPLGSMSRRIPLVEPYYADATTMAQKFALLLQPVGVALDKAALLASNTTSTGDATAPTNSTTIKDTALADYDVLVLGGGPSSLYTAALLSRAGRTVLVLTDESDASGCLTLKQLSSSKSDYRNIPFDVAATNVAKISKQQPLLAPALATTHDVQGGIRFAPVGNAADGYAFEILSVPGLGTDRPDGTIPFVLRAAGGKSCLMEDAATVLGDGWPGNDGSIGHSAVGAYMLACETLLSTASLYFLGKVLPDQVNNLRSTSSFQESAIRYANTFLNKSFPLNTHARSLMAALGMKGENIKPNATSLAAHVTNISSATSGEGMHYPVGGPRALCRALANVVERSGGKVVTEVDFTELIFDERITAGKHEASHTEPAERNKDDNGPKPPRCIGVKLRDGRELRFASSQYDGNVTRSPVVISTMGFIHTFIDLMSETIRNRYKVPRGLPALSERRPVFKALILLQGSKEELDITGAEFYRLPNASVALDEFDADTGAVKFGEIGGKDEREVEDDATANGGDSQSGDKAVDGLDSSSLPATTPFVKRASKGRRVKFEAGSSWLHISFPSGKDPSWKQRHGDVSTCVMTLEADDDFVQCWETKPKLCRPYKTSSTAENQTRLMERIKRDLFDIYPQLEGKIQHGELHGPIRMGLSHNPERYAAKGVRADTPYPGLFVGGSDLTVGDSFSGSVVGGWLVADAVIGYTSIDHLFLHKNLSTDLERFMDNPVDENEEDLAVPFTQEVLKMDGIMDDGDGI